MQKFNELPDTIDLMISENWRDRLIAEYVQLGLRCVALQKHIYSIPNCSPDYELMQKQLAHMLLYKQDLENRLYKEGINLNEL